MVDGNYHKLVGTSEIDSQIDGAISDELSKGVRLAISATRSGTSSVTVDGSVTNNSGAAMSGLTVNAFAVEIGENNHAVNTVKAVLSNQSISSLDSGAQESFSLTGTISGTVTIVVVVNDGSKNVIDCAVLP